MITEPPPNVSRETLPTQQPKGKSRQPDPLTIKRPHDLAVALIDEITSTLDGIVITLTITDIAIPPGLLELVHFHHHKIPLILAKRPPLAPVPETWQDEIVALISYARAYLAENPAHMIAQIDDRREMRDLMDGLDAILAASRRQPKGESGPNGQTEATR